MARLPKVLTALALLAASATAFVAPNAGMTSCRMGGPLCMSAVEEAVGTKVDIR